MKIIFLGPQGSGKSTPAKMLAEKLNVPYIEMGQLLRDKKEGTDEDAKQIRDAMETGVLVTNEITMHVLDQRLKEQDTQNGFVLDGYPRNQEQMASVPEDIDQVLYVKVPDEEAVERLLKRQRADDTPDVIRKRLDVYHQETEPLLEDFSKKGILLEIDGMPTIEQIHEDISKKLNI